MTDIIEWLRAATECGDLSAEIVELLLCLFYLAVAVYLGLLAIAVIGMVIEKIDAIRHRYITLS